MTGLPGAEFEAAFPHPDHSPYTLFTMLTNLIDELLPLAPPPDNLANETWHDIRTAATTALQRNLQTAVRDVLG